MERRTNDRHAPRVSGTCSFLVFPETLAGLGKGGSIEALDLSRSVLSLSVERQVNATSGRWEARVLAESDVAYDVSGRLPSTQVQAAMSSISRIDLNAPVSIGVEHEGGLCLGLIDSVRREAVNMGANVQLTVVLSGRTIGKVLEQDQIAYGALKTPQVARFNSAVARALDPAHPLLVPMGGLWGPKDKDGVITFRGASVEACAKWALSFVPSMRVPLLEKIFGGKGEAGDYFDLDASDSWNGARVWSDQPYTSWGTFDGFLRVLVDMDFYEIRVDERRRDGSPIPQPVLIIRPKPWDDPLLSWAPYSTTNQPDLVRSKARAFVNREIRGAWPVDETEIKSYSVARSDSAVSTYYVCTSAHVIAGTEEARQEGLFFPLLDLWGARKFGLRQRTARLNLVGADVAAKSRRDEGYLSGELAALRDMRNRLFNWHRLESEFMRGQVVLRGRDDYRPGDYIDLPIEPDRGGYRGTRYYITGATWSWEAGGTYTTTLQIDRGYNAAVIESVNDEILDLYERVSRTRSSREVVARIFGGPVIAGEVRQIENEGLIPGMWVAS